MVFIYLHYLSSYRFLSATVCQLVCMCDRPWPKTGWWEINFHSGILELWRPSPDIIHSHWLDSKHRLSVTVTDWTQNIDYQWQWLTVLKTSTISDGDWLDSRHRLSVTVTEWAQNIDYQWRWLTELKTSTISDGDWLGSKHRLSVTVTDWAQNIN